VEIVPSFHFGCLLSRVEAFGISALEYLRLGIPITTAVGALSIPRAPACGFRSADGERVAELRAEVLREPARYATMRKTAARDGVAYRWDRTANEMLSLLDGSTPDT
jgi:hypothetical protein